MKDYSKILDRVAADRAECEDALMAACESKDQVVHLVCVPVLRKMKEWHDMQYWKIRAKCLKM